MKRKSCLIEVIETNLNVPEKIVKTPTCAYFEPTSNLRGEKMYKNSPWYQSLLDAEKSCLKEDKLKKIHYKFSDSREMVEEYNTDTQVLLRRAWKVKAKLGGDGKWDVEVGDPIPDSVPTIESVDLIEAKDQPIVTLRNTRVNLEWRIRNLPYPIEIYSISVNNEDKSITIRTTNKKYFKRLDVLDISRLNLPLDQANLQSSHRFNTLIVMYKKPQELLDFEKAWFEELKKVKPIKDVPNDCKAQ